MNLLCQILRNLQFSSDRSVPTGRAGEELDLMSSECIQRKKRFIDPVSQVEQNAMKPVMRRQSCVTRLVDLSFSS